MHTVTVDTGAIPIADLKAAAAGLAFEFAIVSVTEREVEGTSFEQAASGLETLLEAGVFNESRWGRMVWASDFDARVLQRILSIISNGSWAGTSNPLTKRQRSQLRDAMIFEAHVRNGRDYFVTNNPKDFIEHGRRELLESEFRTKILTSVDFINHCQLLRSS